MNETWTDKDYSDSMWKFIDLKISKSQTAKVI